MASLAVVTSTSSNWISAVRNLICPLCGASMMEFRCLGYCGSDWRQDWERAICAGSKSEGPCSGKSCESIECRQAARADGTVNERDRWQRGNLRRYRLEILV